MVEVAGFGVERVADEFLDMTAVSDGMRYTKVAYVSSVSTGFQKNEYGFVTFYLKDVNANIVQARLFNVADFMLSGVKASAMKNHPVKLTFVVQEFNGRLSLVIDGKEGIEVWDGEFPYEKFIGKVDMDTSTVCALGQKFIPNFEFDSRWSSASFDRIAQGRAGSFAKLFELGLSSICGMEGLVGIDVKELVSVYFIAMQYYFNVLLQHQKLDKFDTFNDHKVLYDIENVYQNDERRMVILDTVKALVGLAKPYGFTACVIKRAVENASFVLNTAYQLNSAPIGTKVTVGGVDVLKY